MPTYDYDCERCGPFTESHPMAEFALPQACPACGEAAAPSRPPPRRSVPIPAVAPVVPRRAGSAPRRSSADASAGSAHRG